MVGTSRSRDAALEAEHGLAGLDTAGRGMDFRMMSRLARPANGIDTDAPAWAAPTADGGDVEPPEHQDLVNGRTRQILEQRRSTTVPRRRGWLIRRLLLLGDIAGLVLAFA